jgi:malate synthase
VLHGQINLRDAIRREIDFETGGKKYKLVENPAVLIVRYVSGILFYSHMLHEHLVVREDGISMNCV